VRRGGLIAKRPCLYLSMDRTWYSDDTQACETILLVSAAREERTFLADNLTADGYSVMEVGSAQGARRVLTQSCVDLAVVDRDLPDVDGMELLRFVRDGDEVAPRVDVDLPLILTSQDASLLDRVRGLERGCDDYLSRPYSYTELRARVGALLRRRRRFVPGARMRVGPLEVDALSRQAWIDGHPVALSGKEFSLLHALAREPGRVFKREELMATVWGWSDGGRTAQRTRTLDAHASRLRRKLSLLGVSYVINVWGIGYRLVDVVGPESVQPERLLAS
jgi:DNA-binding response OmpR family regulator